MDTDKWKLEQTEKIREGAITGLAVLYREKANGFRSTPGFKGAVVHDVKMLPRASMWKPPVFWLYCYLPLDNLCDSLVL